MFCFYLFSYYFIYLLLHFLHFDFRNVRLYEPVDTDLLIWLICNYICLT